MGQAQGQLPDEVATADGLIPPVLVVDPECEHKLKWISPRSTSFKRLLEHERGHPHKRGLSPAVSSGAVSSSETSDGELTSPESDAGSWGHWYDEGARSSAESDRESYQMLGTGQLDSAVATPEHILEESLVTQALWHSSVNRHRFGSDGEPKDGGDQQLPNEFGLPAVRLPTAGDFTTAAAAAVENVPDHDPHCGSCSLKARVRRDRVLYRARSPFGTSVTKTFECPHCGQSTPLMVHIPKFQIVECHNDVHAEFLVVVGLGDVTIGVWRRFSQFQLLADRLFSTTGAAPQQPSTPHPADADEFRMARFSWQCLKRRKRLFRCLDKDYLALKCFLLERFLHDVVFECSSPVTIRDFVGVTVDAPSSTKSKQKRRRRVPLDGRTDLAGWPGDAPCASLLPVAGAK